MISEEGDYSTKHSHSGRETSLSESSPESLNPRKGELERNGCHLRRQKTRLTFSKAGVESFIQNAGVRAARRDVMSKHMRCGWVSVLLEVYANLRLTSNSQELSSGFLHTHA